jgi:hypothetical protein
MCVTAIALACGAAKGASKSIPNIPTSPKAEKDCYDWGRSYQASFDEIIANSRASDQRCKASYKGQYATIQSLCPNTTGGPVAHQNPCGEATKWTQCLWLGFQRGMQACLAGLSRAQSRDKSQAVSRNQEYVGPRGRGLSTKAGEAG